MALGMVDAPAPPPQSSTWTRLNGRHFRFRNPILLAVQFMVQAHALIANRRQHRRFDVRWAGWITLQGHRHSCAVANFSEGGAKLLLPVPVGFPTRFVLRVESPSLRATCETRHQSATEIGVMFVDVEQTEKMNALRAAMAALSS